MKVLRVIGLSIFMLLSLEIFPCEDIDLRRESAVIHDSNMRSQSSGVNNCGALASADIISQALTQHYNYPVFISANTFTTSSFDNGGTFSESLANIRSQGNKICTLPLTDLGGKRKTATKLQAIPIEEKQNRELIGEVQSENNSEETTSPTCDEAMAVMNSNKEKKLGLFDIIGRIFSGQKKSGNTQFQRRGHRSSRRKLAGNSKIVSDQKCADNQLQSLDVKLVEKRISASQTQIESALKNKKAIYISYDLRNVYDPDKLSRGGMNQALAAQLRSTSKARRDIPAHASSIIAQKKNEKTGKCQVLVRNVAGTRCDIYRNELDCENGNFWITIDQLKANGRHLDASIVSTI